VPSTGQSALAHEVFLHRTPSSAVPLTSLQHRRPTVPCYHPRIKPDIFALLVSNTSSCSSHATATIQSPPAPLTTTPANPLSKQTWQTRTMARSSSSNSNSSRSNHSTSDYFYCNDNSSVAGSNVKASCYAVDACTTVVQGFHYSTTGAGGVDWRS
jgi:hypothetical protein